MTVDRAQWQVGGSAPEVYERDLVPAVFGPWARLVVDFADLRPGDRVLDVACGTGVVARIAAEKVGERGAVVAADLNSGMLAVAGSLPAPRGATVEWRQADAGALPFADQAFDVVLCQLGLQFFADRAIALREMYRVLRPRGDVVVMVWRPIERSPGFAALAAALERHIGPDAASIMRAPFSLGDAEELSSLLAAGGFEGLDLRASTGAVRFASVERFVATYVAGSPLAEPVAAAPPEARDALLAEVLAKLERLVSRDELKFPIEAHLARARRPASRGLSADREPGGDAVLSGQLGGTHGQVQATSGAARVRGQGAQGRHHVTVPEKQEPGSTIVFRGDAKGRRSAV